MADSTNKTVRNALAANANGKEWVKEYKNQIKDKMAELDGAATAIFALLRDYGKNARDEAKRNARNDEWKKIDDLGRKFLPDLRRAANIIQGLRRDADAL